MLTQASPTVRNLHAPLPATEEHERRQRKQQKKPHSNRYEPHSWATADSSWCSTPVSALGTRHPQLQMRLVHHGWREQLGPSIVKNSPKGWIQKASPNLLRRIPTHLQRRRVYMKPQSGRSRSTTDFTRRLHPTLRWSASSAAPSLSHLAANNGGRPCGILEQPLPNTAMRGKRKQRSRGDGDPVVQTCQMCPFLIPKNHQKQTSTPVAPARSVLERRRRGTKFL